MFKNTLRLICFMAVALGHHANNFAAQTPIQQDNVAPNTTMEEDTFIKEFVKTLGNPKVQYDGKKLIINSDPSHLLIFIEAIATLYFVGLTFGLTIALIERNESPKTFLCLLIPLLLAILPTSSLMDDLDAKYNHNHPLITLDKDGIGIGEKRIKWMGIDLLKKEMNSTFKNSKRISTKVFYKFFDKFMTRLLNINSDIGNLPINFNNLQVVLDYYINKYGKNIKIETEENKFNEITVNHTIYCSPFTITG